MGTFKTSWDTSTTACYPRLGRYLSEHLTDFMGDFVDDFDVDAYEEEYVGLVQELLDEEHAIHYIGSGIFYVDYYRDDPLPDEDDLFEEIYREIDECEIAKRHEIR